MFSLQACAQEITNHNPLCGRILVMYAGHRLHGRRHVLFLYKVTAPTTQRLLMFTQVHVKGDCLDNVVVCTQNFFLNAQRKRITVFSTLV